MKLQLQLDRRTTIAFALFNTRTREYSRTADNIPYLFESESAASQFLSRVVHPDNRPYMAIVSLDRRVVGLDRVPEPWICGATRALRRAYYRSAKADRISDETIDSLYTAWSQRVREAG